MTGRSLLSVLALAAVALCGCPPPDPAIAMVGVVPSQTSDGRSRLGVTVTNAGNDDHEGDICLRVVWVKDAVFEIEGKALVRKRGDVLEEQRSCHATLLDVGAETALTLESSVPTVPGTFAIVTMEEIRHASGRTNAAQEIVVSAD
jgi:hypothetical protein